MPRRAEAPQRLLTTVMFTDIVGSTRLAAEMGDRRWRQVLARHHAVVRGALKRHKGREVDTAGDGFLATFEQPSRAIACAIEITQSLRTVGVEIRVRINMGEVEVIAPKVGGIAVHVGSRVMSMAGPGEVWLTGTVRDLMAGSDVKFDDRGIHELKGVPGQWRLHSVSPGLASEPIPEGAVEAPPRPWGWIAEHVPLIALLVLGVVTALIVALVVASRDGGEGAAPTPAANSAVQIDPGTGELVSVAEVGTDPTAVAYGLDSIWVANFSDRTVQRVDPSTGDPDSPIGIASGNPIGITTGQGSVWVTSSIDGIVYRIDPRTRGTREIAVGTGVQGIAFGEGAVWVTNGQTNEVLRIDPVTEGVERIEMDDDSQPSGIAVGAGFVWVAEHLTGRVAQIDPAALEVVETIPLLRGRPDQVAFGAGFVWVAVGSDDSVLRIDPASRVRTTIDNVGNQPAGIGVGAGGVWVANALDGTVVRIDPQRAELVDEVRLGFSPQGVAASPEGIWVTLSG
jgi:class 3 adenylate cyclase/streptogramin lyase